MEAMLLFIEDDSLESDTIAVIGQQPFAMVETVHRLKPLKAAL